MSTLGNIKRFLDDAHYHSPTHVVNRAICDGLLPFRPEMLTVEVRYDIDANVEVLQTAAKFGNGKVFHDLYLPAGDLVDLLQCDPQALYRMIAAAYRNLPLEVRPDNIELGEN